MIIRVERDGTIRSIYRDDAPLSGLGLRSIERAGSVEHDDELGGWTVTFPDGAMLPGAWEHRRDALAAEVAEVERRLRNGGGS